MKVAVVTGASGGIGLQIVKELVYQDYFVVAVYSKNKRSLENLMEDLKNDGLDGLVFPVGADLSVLKNVETLSNVIFSSFKHVDVFVSNAGVDLYKTITDTTEQDLVSLMNINFNSAYLLTSKISSSMVSNQKGKIIYISSVWGSVGASMETAYSSSKSALIGLTKGLAKELASSNITVNCICPGVIDTPMNDCFTEQEKQEIKERIPLSRFGSAEEVAKLVGFLCSNNAEYITGQVITIDGGFTL